MDLYFSPSSSLAGPSSGRMPRPNRASLDSFDPLTAAIAPPSDETPEARAKREQEEAEAKRISDAIDEQLKTERLALKKKKPPIKVLLLGQSESGASIPIRIFFPRSFFFNGRQVNDCQKYVELCPAHPYSHVHEHIQTFSWLTPTMHGSRSARHGDPSSFSTSCVP